jgi:hypothetical protein
MAAKDGLEAGGKFIEELMTQVQKPAKTGEQPISLDDKLKVMDRWIKYQTLKARVKSGGLGSGFDQGGDDDEAGGI